MLRVAVDRWIWTSGTAMGLLMAFFFSFSVNCMNVSTKKYITAVYYAFGSSIIKLMSGMLMSYWSGAFPLFGEKKMLPWLALSGFTAGAGVTLIYPSVSMIHAVDAVALFYISPIVAAIIGAVVFKDKLGFVACLGMLLYFTGMIFLTKPEFIFRAENLAWTQMRKIGTTFSVLSGVLMAIGLNIMRGLGKRLNPATAPLWAYIAQFVYTFPLLFLFPPVPNNGSISWLTFVPMIGGGLMATVGEICLCRACHLLPAGHASALESTQLIWVAIWGWIFVNETLNWHQGVGAICMMLGVAAVGFGSTR